MEVAISSNDEVLLESYKDILRTIRQSNYKSFKKKDLEALWFFADAGERTCDMLLEQSTNATYREKAINVRLMYAEIKQDISKVAEKKNREGKATNV